MSIDNYFMKDFRFRIFFRTILLGGTIALFIFMITRPNMLIAAGFM